MPLQLNDSSDGGASEFPSTSGAGNTRGAAKPPVRRGISRRRFIAAAAATGIIAGAGYYARRGRVRLGIIGAGRRGAYHAALLKWMSYALDPFGEVVAICDADVEKAKTVQSSGWPHASVYQDYRDLLANGAVEAVFIATPDHWHAGMAIDAMLAGKAVYVEKPLTLTIEEAWRLHDVVEQTGAVLQVGTQQRSHKPFHRAWELVRNGRLGRLTKIVVTMGQLGILSGPCNPRLERAPKSLDWNLWLGPTAEVPYCDFRHSHWWGIAEYSGGMVTNWGSHHLDVALWASGNHLTFPTVVDGNGTIPEIAAGTGLPNDFAVTFQYPNDLVIEMRTTPKDHGILFVGEEGQVFVNRARVSGKPFEDLAANPLPASAQRVNSQRAPGSRQKLAEIQHYRDFFDCMATKATPISDVNSGVCCVTALHLANISIALHRAVHFDPETLAVKDDAEALAMSSRPRRSPFLL